jgi:hypothetical protein
MNTNLKWLLVCACLCCLNAFAATLPPTPDQLIIRELRQRINVLEDATPHASVVGELRHAETMTQMDAITHLLKLADASDQRRLLRLAGQDKAAKDQADRANNSRRLQCITACLHFFEVTLLMLLFSSRRRVT